MSGVSLKARFEQFAKNPSAVLDQVRQTSKISAPGVLWEAVLGNLSGPFASRGGVFLTNWESVDENSLREMKGLLEEALASLDPGISERYSEEVARLRELAQSFQAIK